MKGNSILFLGSKQAGFNACQAIIQNTSKGTLCAIITPNDLDDKRNVRDKFIELARMNSIPLYTVNTTAETIGLIKKLQPKFALVHGWYKILPVEEVPDTIFLAFHYSALPKYRGHAPLVWQIINGEKNLAVSFFQLTTAMDDGDLVDQRFFSITNEEDIADALNKADCLTEEMLIDFLPSLQSTPLKLLTQSKIGASYCGLRIPDDGKIDWNKNAEEVHNFIRAQGKPYPGAFTFLPDGDRLTLLKSELVDKTFFGSPGGIVEILQDSVVIACGRGAIRLKKFSLNNGDEMTVSDVFKSFKIRLS
jgi:methionyl-tRNA formyltransferase